MAVTHRTHLSDEERAERRARDREYAREAVARLRSSEGWQRWLATRRHFHAYSLANQLLIAMARPSATRVAGFRAWLKLGYCVRKRPADIPEGQWAIRIWAPCPRAASNSSAGSATAPTPASGPAPSSDSFRCSAGYLVFGQGMSSRLVGRSVTGRSPACCCSSARPRAHGRGRALACAVVAEPAPGGRRRSGDRARVSPGTPPRTKAR